MNNKSFVFKTIESSLEKGKITWESPSNIALVKYWGKKENQIPANPSISFTLSNCKTTTTLHYTKLEVPSKEYQFSVFLEGEQKDDFKPKINTFFKRIEQYVPFIKEYAYKIETSNSFPHSSGIASSASGMSALALCIMSMEKELNPNLTQEEFIKKASFLARLGSGSACRSLEGDLVCWGAHKEITGSSDLFGVKYPFEVHSNFKNYQDTILLVDKGEKQVSSTVGHNLMHNHPYADNRFNQAHDNLSKLIHVFKSGDLKAFIEIVESEALTLHAMMMTSLPYFILMKPNTLEIINKIWAFRQQTGLHLCFTLDAGANVHLLYPEVEKEEVLAFINSELVGYCQNEHYICDTVGFGAQLIKD
ncbi:diphosphomevalonate/mevalonate 3,5-bisphosphate decarboxylase family protein [Pseudofulvibacter geojedonensis]|uniref:Diphosphomevalonate/mevalonate 3,5-bisphosphate decarboxylase family protein n=1 Tax=Pseudofulvibacter geojedonensis TaxID=1123758 RepID=A0ABW3I686_9FLAO